MSSRGPIKKQTLEILRERGVPVSTVLDVGVLDGTPELIKAFPDVKHVLFEPVEEFREKIDQRYSGMTYALHQVAVAEKSGSVMLKTSSNGVGSAITHSSMLLHNTSSLSECRVVPMVTVDEIVAAHGYSGPFLLKIDIDGHELKVLQGAQHTLSMCSIVIVECPRSQLTQRIAAVESAGFILFDLSEPCYYDKAFWQCDGIFLRSELHKDLFQQLSGRLLPGMYEIFRG